MNVRLDYLKVGDARIHLRANKAGEGEGAMGATAARRMPGSFLDTNVLVYLAQGDAGKAGFVEQDSN
jgi:hypothetical protein